MTQCKILATTIILSAFIATPSFAQRMIEEPGMLTFTYPNGDLGIGSTRPAADATAFATFSGNGNGPHVVRKPRPAVARRYNLLIRPTSI
jgi:hypothetical protein